MKENSDYDFLDIYRIVLGMINHVEHAIQQLFSASPGPNCNFVHISPMSISVRLSNVQKCLIMIVSDISFEYHIEMPVQSCLRI